MLRLAIRSCMVWVLGAMAAPVLAQDTVAGFEAAITEGNRLRTLVESAQNNPLNSEDFVNATAALDNTTRQLQPLLDRPQDSMHTAARYWLWNAQYQYLQLLALNGNENGAFEWAEKIEKEADSLLKAEFPIEFKGENKYFIVHQSDFESLVTQYFARLGAWYFKKPDPAKALAALQKAQDLFYLEGPALVQNTDYIFQIKSAEAALDEQMLSAALGLFQEWNVLDENTRNALPDVKNVPQRCADAIEQILNAHPEWSDNGEIWARTARLLTDEGMDARAVSFAVNAINSGYTDREFLLSTFPLAERVGDKSTARLAVDKLAEQLSDDQCDYLALVADNYEKLDLKPLAGTYRTKAERCQKNQAKQQRLSTREGGLYLGTYVLPWFRTDWGAVAGIQTRKWYLEFSYQELSDRRDRLYDLRFRGVDGAVDQTARWDGYYTHFAVNRTSGKRNSKSYTGLLLGYNERNYQTMVVNSIFDGNGNMVNSSPARFNAKEERYILMFNSGTHMNGRWLASDIFFSLGGAWSTFDRGNATYEARDLNFEGNPLLSSRKLDRFSLMARFGLTVGLQVGPRTFEAKKKKKEHS